MVDIAPVHELSHMGNAPMISIILEQKAQRLPETHRLNRHRASFAEKQQQRPRGLQGEWARPCEADRFWVC